MGFSWGCCLSVRTPHPLTPTTCARLPTPLLHANSAFVAHLNFLRELVSEHSCFVNLCVIDSISQSVCPGAPGGASSSNVTEVSRGGCWTKESLSGIFLAGPLRAWNLLLWLWRCKRVACKQRFPNLLFTTFFHRGSCFDIEELNNLLGPADQGSNVGASISSSLKLFICKMEIVVLALEGCCKVSAR